MRGYNISLLLILKSKAYIFVIDVFKSWEKVVIEEFDKEIGFDIFILRINRKRYRSEKLKFLRKIVMVQCA